VTGVVFACVVFATGSGGRRVSMSGVDKYRESIMVFSAIGEGYKSKLCTCQGNLSQARYNAKPVGFKRSARDVWGSMGKIESRSSTALQKPG
jgi:hypothetical protein